MDFKDLEIATIAQLRTFLKYISTNTCDYTVGGMFMWRRFFKMQYAIEDGVFYSRLFDADGKEYYNLPLSEDMEGALRHLVEKLRKNGDTIRFCTVPEAYLPMFERNFSIQTLAEQRDYFDYLYNTEDLAALQGKKYSNQRNLIRQFERNTHSHSLKEITQQDIPAIRKFFLEHYPLKQDDPAALEEQEMVLDVIDHFESYGMVGGILLADDAIAGFSLGEYRNDTFFVHIEKSLRDIKGAYQMLAHRMAVQFAQGTAAFINREEDMGDPGLQKAKEAYHPVALLKKYIVEVT